jgi:hypothetical protein
LLRAIGLQDNLGPPKPAELRAFVPLFLAFREIADLVVEGAVYSELVSDAGAAISLLNREKTGNFSRIGRYGGIFGRINSSNQ